MKMKRTKRVLFLLPGLVILIGFTYLPLIIGLIMSLFGGNGQDLAFVGLDNYIALVDDANFKTAFINSIEFSIIISPIVLVLSIALAIGLNSIKNKRVHGAILILLYLPCITSPIAYSLFFKQLAYSDGLLTQLFYIFGIGAGDESILANPIIAKLFISFICIWAWTGFYVLIINSALQNMDISIIKAAKIDGASSFRILIKIILPSLASVLLLVVILTSCSAFQIYIEISLITKGGPAMSTFTLVFYLYRKTFTYVADYGYSIAIGMVILLISLFISSIFLIVKKVSR